MLPRGARGGLVALSVCALATAACNRAPRPASSGVQQGIPGQTWYVNLFTPPIGGVISSDVGGISCGAASAAIDNSVDPPQYQYAWYGAPPDQTNRCGQTRLPWGQAVVLTATPRDGNAFIGWAGDCDGATPICTLTSGPDRMVVAIFGPPGSAHTNFTSPARHGPAYLDFVGAVPGALTCTRCHGSQLEGFGIAPACDGCHASRGWVGWRSNCSFCHGARNATTRAGYDVAQHPTWSAPPDAVSERLGGMAAPERTGAHQAHLGGRTAEGLTFALPIACDTCHDVPVDVGHVRGSAARANVRLQWPSAGGPPAPLGTYDPSSGTCTTYCHGVGPSPAWSATGLRCGACHDLPPAPATGHPAVQGDTTACALCHPDTVASDGSLDVAGGKHVDGQVEATGHADISAPSDHGPRALASFGGAPGSMDCRGCHGQDYGGGLGPSCNACHAQAGWTGWQANCSFCHGTRSAEAMAGYDVAQRPRWSAPPDSVDQRLTGTAVPERTGAHQAHLSGATAAGQALARPFRCETCHAVPTGLSHVQGGGARAAVALHGAGQASLPDDLGTWDSAKGSCATRCHGSDPSPAWGGSIACGGCHGLPPDRTTGHPGVTGGLSTCVVCHAGTVRADGSIDVVGGLHVDGRVEAIGHGDIASPTLHGPMALDFLGGTPDALDCRMCHGAGLDGGLGPSCNACHAANGWVAWQGNCSFCHGTRSDLTKPGYDVVLHPAWSAPPDAIGQRLGGAPAPERTGAHQAHLSGVTSGGLTVAQPWRCETCHAVPTDTGHVRGSAARAKVALSGAGQGSWPASLGSYDPTSGACATPCHGSAASPDWRSPGLACDGCHGLPPAKTTGHPSVVGGVETCGACHAGTVRPDGTIDVAGGLHVDGRVEATGHGDLTSPATHGPLALDFLGGVPGAMDCGKCHGADLGGGLAPSCNGCHAGAGWAGWRTNCSFCHGTRSGAAMAGYDVDLHPAWSAPPDALAERLGGAPAPERTGAHQAHLAGVTAAGAALSGPWACATCHDVPADTGHVRGANATAVVRLSGAGQGALPDALGTYDRASGTCATACHGAAPSPPWRGSAACGACHALPPAPSTGHPAVVGGPETCAACHPGTALPDGTIDVAGGRHVDGVVEATYHGAIGAPAIHGPMALDFLGGTPGALDCSSCHGADLGGGLAPSCNGCHAASGWTGWQTNCSFCHGARNATTKGGYDVAQHPTWSAPPDALSQRLTGAPDTSRTGAHQAHLAGTTAGGLSFARPFTCATCHTVPADAGHVRGSTARAEVKLSGAGQGFLPDDLGSYDQGTGSCATRCHGVAPSLGWSSTGVACGDCHALPPSTATGHPAVSGGLTTCSACHPGTVKPEGTLDVAGGKHVDGLVEVVPMHPSYTSPATHGPAFFAYQAGTSPYACKGCHGAAYGGGVGPSCNGCHATTAGWTGWQTNCSFCHGARNTTTKAGYSVALQPGWSAPPDAVAQRLGGGAAPARTGAHQPHLAGVGSDGRSYAPKVPCATCHTVPADQSHAVGARAPVVLRGSGGLPAGLGSYDPATGTCSTYCHGSTMVDSWGWTAPGPAWSGSAVSCGLSCHGAPPDSGGDIYGETAHMYHANTLNYACLECHQTSVDAALATKAAHLNGAVDLSFARGGSWNGTTCTVKCHGTSAMSWR